VFFRLFYESGEEILPCDKVMTLFDLPSCPETVRHADGEAYVFSGLGEGHGRGLSLETARHMALRGESPIDILKDAYGDERFTKSCSSSPVLDRKLLTR
jgi:peptidoglycan hydrolase-like amidase